MSEQRDSVECAIRAEDSDVPLSTLVHRRHLCAVACVLSCKKVSKRTSLTLSNVSQRKGGEHVFDVGGLHRRGVTTIVEDIGWNTHDPCDEEHPGD